jgi:hypothetical protein
MSRICGIVVEPGEKCLCEVGQVAVRNEEVGRKRRVINGLDLGNSGRV